MIERPEKPPRRGPFEPFLRYCKCVCLVAAGFGAASAPAHAEVVSLAELERLALNNRPALAREAARARAAEADLQKAASAYYPQFALRADVNVGPGRQLLQYQQPNGGTAYLVQGAPSLLQGSNKSRAFVGYPRSGLELSASANLYDFGRTASATQAARASKAATLATRELTEAELRTQVRDSYLHWLLSSELLRLSREALIEATQRNQHIAALIAEGVKSKGEQAPARAEQLLAKLEAERAERDETAARLLVEQAAGTALPREAEPDTALLSEARNLPDRSEQTARHMNALTQRLKAARSFADAQEKLNRPQLGIGLSAGVRTSTQKITCIAESGCDGESDKPQTSIFPLYGAGLTFNVPLWDGGFTRAAADSARARADEAKADLAEFERERDLSQREAELDAQSAKERLSTAEELIEVCTVRLRDAEAGYELGVATFEAVAQARGLLRRAKTEALLARVDQTAARLRMVRSDADRAR